MEEEIGKVFPVKAVAALALNPSGLGSGQTDGQERRGNGQFSRNITSLCPPQPPAEVITVTSSMTSRAVEKGNHITEWAAFLSPRPFEGQESAETQRIWDEPDARHG